MNNFGNNIPTVVGGAGQMSSSTSDPNTAHMRVFVGNLNTMNITKPTLQNIFGQYGSIAAISIHRGFAFIQYNNAYAARSAVQGEHGSVIDGQTIDINISSEPKPNQKPATPQGGPGTNQSGFGGNAYGGFNVSSNGGFDAGQAGWNQTPKRGRGGARGGTRGGARGANSNRGTGHGTRGRGGGRGRGAPFGGGPPNKIQTGRVEKPYLLNKNKFNVVKKPMLPPLAARTITVESPVIGSIKSQISGTLSSAIGPDGKETIDLEAFKQELVDVRDKINSLLQIFPAQLKLNNQQIEAPTETTNVPEVSMELEVKKEV